MTISLCFGCRSQCFGGPHSCVEGSLGGKALPYPSWDGGAEGVHTRRCVVRREARSSTCICQFDPVVPRSYLCVLTDRFWDGGRGKHQVPFHPVMSHRGNELHFLFSLFLTLFICFGLHLLWLACSPPQVNANLVLALFYIFPLCNSWNSIHLLCNNITWHRKIKVRPFKRVYTNEGLWRQKTAINNEIIKHILGLQCC